MRALSLLLLLSTLGTAQTAKTPAAKAPAAKAPTATHVTRGFVNPECALWDATGKCWYVSNLAGGSAARDGRAFISRLDADGKVLEKEWVKGLDAPKGMGLSGRMLYVVDIDHVSVIDIQKAQFVRRIPVQGAKFLSDLAVGPKGDIFVSDMERSVIYRLGLDTPPEVFVADKRLECPNGLWVEGDSMVVACWGTITDGKFGTRIPGGLLNVDLRTKRITPITARKLGNLDGLVKLGRAYYVSDNKGGQVFKVEENGTPFVLKSGFMAAADLGVDRERKLLAIPDMAAGSVTFLTVE